MLEICIYLVISLDLLPQCSSYLICGAPLSCIHRALLDPLVTWVPLERMDPVAPVVIPAQVVPRVLWVWLALLVLKAIKEPRDSQVLQ